MLDDAYLQCGIDHLFKYPYGFYRLMGRSANPAGTKPVASSELVSMSHAPVASNIPEHVA